MTRQIVRNRDNGITAKGVATRFGFHSRKEADAPLRLNPAFDSDNDFGTDPDVDNLPISGAEAGDWLRELDTAENEAAERSAANRRAARAEALDSETQRVLAAIGADESRITAQDSALFNPHRFVSNPDDTLLPTRRLWAADIQEIAREVAPPSDRVDMMLEDGDVEGLRLEVNAGETTDEDDIAILLTGSPELKRHLLETTEVSPYASMLALCDTNPSVRDAALRSPFTAGWVLGRMRAVKSYDVHRALASNVNYPYLREVVQDRMQDPETRRVAFATLRSRETTPVGQFPTPVRKVDVAERERRRELAEYERQMVRYRSHRQPRPYAPAHISLTQEYDRPRYGQVSERSETSMLDSPWSRRQSEQRDRQPYAAL